MIVGKEKILQKCLDEIGKGNTTEVQFCYDAIKKSMDEYAKEVSIYFMEWVMLKHKSGNMDLIGKNSFEGFDLFDKEVLQKINKKENNIK